MLTLLSYLYDYLKTYDAVLTTNILSKDEFKILRAISILEEFKLPVDRVSLSYLTGLPQKRVERALKKERFKEIISDVELVKAGRDVLRLDVEGLTLLEKKMWGRHVVKKRGRPPLLCRFGEPRAVKCLESIFQNLREMVKNDEELQKLIELAKEEQRRRFEEEWGEEGARILKASIAFRLFGEFITKSKPLIDSFTLDSEILKKLFNKLSGLGGRYEDLVAKADKEYRAINDVLTKLKRLDKMDEWKRITLLYSAFSKWVKESAFKEMPTNLQKAKEQEKLFDEILSEVFTTLMNIL